MILKNIFKLFYPTFCQSCKKLIEQDFIFCYDCSKKIKPLVSVFAKITDTKSIKVFAASEYKEPLRSLVLKKSYSDSLASKQLARLILQHTPIKDLEIDYIIPIALHWTRYAKRGYNQSYVMAKVLSKSLNVPVLDLLKRKRRTTFQSKLSSAQRQENVKNVFGLKLRYRNKALLKERLKDKNVLFVDDLYTTGATLKNSAKVIKNFGIKSFYAVVPCRVV